MSYLHEIHAQEKGKHGDSENCSHNCSIVSSDGVRFPLRIVSINFLNTRSKRVRCDRTWSALIKALVRRSLAERRVMVCPESMEIGVLKYFLGVSDTNWTPNGCLTERGIPASNIQSGEKALGYKGIQGPTSSNVWVLLCLLP